MYMRVTRGRIDPARIDELTGGQLVAVSTWDTEEHARWPRQALGDFVPRLQALGVQLDPPEFFEVTTT
jgi:hypothetical protein